MNSILTLYRWLLLLILIAPLAWTHAAGQPAKRAGKVHLDGYSLVDDDGAFPALGVSYFTALWRCKHDRARLEMDLAFLQRQGFNFFRMLSMVGYHAAWEGLEIAPVACATRRGKLLAPWPDYWEQLKTLADLAYDKFGLRTQITLFADAQLMPDKKARIEHMRRILSDVVPGREHKIILLEVANEAWQNGFPGDHGVADLREFTRFLSQRTDILVATTSNHDWPELGSPAGFDQVYKDSSADIATWHFSRDRRTDDGWKPVYDCWEFGQRPGLPPVSSNEPIGPGSSVNTERDPLRLVMAAAFAYVAKLPMYVFHCEAGVFGKTRFEDSPGIDHFAPMLRLLPPDVANWERHDGQEPAAPLRILDDGCIRNIGSRKGTRFICVPIGIKAAGLELEAREDLRFKAHDPLTGETLKVVGLKKGERTHLAAGPGALILLGESGKHE